MKDPGGTEEVEGADTVVLNQKMTDDWKYLHSPTTK